jgi:hypothetical protein
VGSAECKPPKEQTGELDNVVGEGPRATEGTEEFNNQTRDELQWLNIVFIYPITQGTKFAM